MPWVILALSATFGWSVVNVMDKYILSKYVKEPVIPVFILGFLGLIVSLLIHLIRGYAYLSLLNIILAFIGGALYILANLFYFKAVKIEEVSRVVPIFCSVPIFVGIMAAAFLGEIFTPLTYLGIFLLIIGGILISTKKLSKIRVGKAFWLMILSSLLFAIELVIVKHLTNNADFWTVFSYIRIGTIFAIIPLIYMYLPEFKFVFSKFGKKALGLITISESLNLGSSFIYMMAISISFVTLVDALSSFQYLFLLIFTVILSVFFPKIIKEEISKKIVLQKLISIIFMIVGVYLIT